MTGLTHTFGKSYCSKEIDLHDLSVHHNVCLHDTASGADPGIVDEDVHMTECLQSLSRLLRKGRGEGEVEREDLGREARRMGGLFVCVYVQMCRKGWIVSW